MVEISMGDLRKAHLHLRYCSERTLIAKLRSAHMTAPEELISELYKDFKCQLGVRRIAPPNVSRRIAKYNGETVGVDVCFPFYESHQEIKGGKADALIAVDSLPRYANCSLIARIAGECILATSSYDWVRPLGKPRLILLDHSGPGFRCKIWTDRSGLIGCKIICAPPGTQSQNGLSGRAVRSLKVAARNILSTESRPEIEQRVLTSADIARNHSARTITGIPPDLAMLGLCDILAGYAATAFNHNPESTEHVVRQNQCNAEHYECSQRSNPF